MTTETTRLLDTMLRLLQDGFALMPGDTKARQDWCCESLDAIAIARRVVTARDSIAAGTMDTPAKQSIAAGRLLSVISDDECREAVGELDRQGDYAGFMERPSPFETE